MKNKNTYENTEITDSGANKYMSGIHNRCIRTNQYIWDMMKVLDKQEMYGFHFQAKVGAKKILVILHHENKEQLDKAQKILKNVEKNSNVLFLTKLKEKKDNSRKWIIAFRLIFLTVIMTFILSFLYKDGYLNSMIEILQHREIVEQSNFEKNLKMKEKEPVKEEIVVDIEKLKLLKESFEEQNSTNLSPKVMKALSMTTGIISEMVSEEEKEKYSTEALVKSFKGKSGFKLVIKASNLSKEFNNTIEELNAYVLNFVKENNLSEALKYYDKVLQEKNVSKKEVMIASSHQAEIFEKVGLNAEAKIFYSKALKLSELLKENNQTIHKLNELVMLGHLGQLHQNLNEPQKAEAIREKAEMLYKLLIIELKKQGELKSEELVFALNYLASFYIEKDEHFLSIEIRKEALSIYEKLLQKTYKKFALSYYKSLNALAQSYLKTEKFKLAKQNYEKALKLMEKLLKSKIVKNKAYMALSYRALAMVAIKDKKFKEAKKYYLNASKIYHNLLIKEKSYELPITEMYGEFAVLYASEKKFNLAKGAYQKGIFKFIQMNKKTPLRYHLEIAKLLNSFALMKIKNYDMNSTEVLRAKIELRESKAWAKKAIELNFKEAKECMAESYAYLAYIAGVNKDMDLALEYYKVSYALKKIKGIKSFRLLNLGFH